MFGRFTIVAYFFGNPILIIKKHVCVYLKKQVFLGQILLVCLSKKESDRLLNPY